MKILLFILFLVAPLTMYSQCTTQPGFACASQSTFDRMSKALDELAASRDALQKFTNERAANDALNAASLQVIKAANDVIAFKDKVIADQDAFIVKMTNAYDKVITLQQVLIDKLTAQLSKPTSAWSKFVQTVEKITMIALGITIGRGL
jgi:hypothetical protein